MDFTTYHCCLVVHLNKYQSVGIIITHRGKTRIVNQFRLPSSNLT